MATIDAASAAPAVTNQTANFNVQDFMKILLTQLAYQDPMKPMDNQQFMSQIAQFTTLEQSQQLNQKIDQLLDGRPAAHRAHDGRRRDRHLAQPSSQRPLRRTLPCSIPSTSD